MIDFYLILDLSVKNTCLGTIQMGLKMRSLFAVVVFEFLYIYIAAYF